jgi:hypothetical protein
MRITAVLALCLLSLVSGATAKLHKLDHNPIPHKSKKVESSAHGAPASATPTKGRHLSSSCSNHNACGATEYCYEVSPTEGGECWDCAGCYADQDSIDGRCPSKCSHAEGCSVLYGNDVFLPSVDLDYDYDDNPDNNVYAYWERCRPFEKKANRWCKLPDYPEYCFSNSGDDCCEVNGGAVAGLVVGLVVGLIGIITLILFYGGCCCFRRKEIVAMQQPQQMQQPQVVVVPAGTR